MSALVDVSMKIRQLNVHHPALTLLFDFHHFADSALFFITIGRENT